MGVINETNDSSLILKRFLGRRNALIAIILFTCFLDAVGIGLVFPIASPLLLEKGGSAFLPTQTAASVRGALIGVVMAGFTIGQFFSAPIVGALSDLKGRRRWMILTLLLSVFSYLLGGASILKKSVMGLILSRFLAGAAAGNCSVIQAAMADLCEKENKAKYFGWVGASFGLGFIFGPYLGGKLSDPQLLSYFNYATPFWVACAMSALNLILVFFIFQETHRQSSLASWSLWVGLLHLKKAFRMHHFRALFGVMFIYFLGWELFCIFGPIYLIDSFQVGPSAIANFYFYLGLGSAFGNGVLMRFTMRYPPEKVLRFAFPLWAVSLLSLTFVHSPSLFWMVMMPLPCVGAVIFCTGSTLVSNLGSKETQGEILGIYQSVQSAALMLPPLCAGSIVAVYPYFPIIGGTICLAVASAIWWAKSPK